MSTTEFCLNCGRRIDLTRDFYIKSVQKNSKREPDTEHVFCSELCMVFNHIDRANSFRKATRGTQDVQT